MVLYVVLVTLLLLWQAHYRFLTLRQRWLVNLPSCPWQSARANTILVEHIPDRLRNAILLRRYFGEADVDSVNFVKRTGQLKAFWRQLKEAKSSLGKANSQL